MGKGKAKNNNKPNKAPRRGTNQPPNRLPKASRPTPYTDATLTTCELLEAILLQLDHRTLLVTAQRVNTLWHRTITNSPALQRRPSSAASSSAPAPTPRPRSTAKSTPS